MDDAVITYKSIHHFNLWRTLRGVNTPPETIAWRKHVQSYITDDMEYLDGPLDIEMVFYMPRPKSLPKKVIQHVSKPDVDNP